MKANARVKHTVTISVMLYLVVSARRGLAQGDLPPLPDSGDSCALLETHAPTILSYWWLVSCAFALATGIFLHWLKARSIARHWRGEQPTWVQFWILPVVVATLVYAVVCGAFLLYVSQACPLVGNYFQTNVGMTHAGALLLGELLVILPALICAIRRRETATAGEA